MARERRKLDSTSEPNSETTQQLSDSKTSVLVVDDDIRILNFIRVSLGNAGYDVITATGGRDALNLVDSAKPDVMVLDLVMSPIDGFEVLEKLRKTSDMPVIVITAHSSAVSEALKLGASAFLNKPFDPDRLVREIKFLLSQRK